MAVVPVYRTTIKDHLIAGYIMSVASALALGWLFGVIAPTYFAVATFVCGFAGAGVGAYLADRIWVSAAAALILRVVIFTSAAL